MNRIMQLPPPSDPQAIFQYAMSFNAYEVYGSFEAAAEVARRAQRSSIEEIRAELFFKARAARHAGSESYVAAYAELRPLLEKFSHG
ncbi:hypothetical protein [Roseateles puraquae]|uniref:hypothetical protein n=1 Tax=Roseateles puraquae TaxID=431059 RepID=UPI0031D2277D